MSLVVTDFLSCGWPYSGNNFFRVGPNISLKSIFLGEPILEGSKLNVTGPHSQRDLIPRLTPFGLGIRPVGLAFTSTIFRCFQYANMEGKDLGDVVTSGDDR